MPHADWQNVSFSLHFQSAKEDIRTGSDCYSAMYLIHWFHSSLSLPYQIRIDWKNELKDFKKISKKQKRISKKK